MLNPDTFSRLQEALVAEHDRWMNTYEEIVKVMQVVGVHMTPLSLWRRRLAVNKIVHIRQTLALGVWAMSSEKTK